MNILTQIQKQIQFFENRRNVIYKIEITERAVEVHEFKCPDPNIFSDVRENCWWEYVTEFKTFDELIIFFNQQAM